MRYSLPIILSLTLLVASTGCSREEDDLITTPTATSTTVAGIIRTPDGTPLPDLPVSVDYVSSSIFGTVVKHKAKAKTDRSGCYKLFFEIGRDVADGDITKNYTLSIDLGSLSAEKYLIPFSDSKYEQHIDTREAEGKSFACKLTVPRRKDITVSVVNNGIPLEKGEYAVGNRFTYGSEDLNYKHEEQPIELSQSTPIDLKQNAATSVAIPCGIGISCSIGLLYLGNREDIYYVTGLNASDIKTIVATESSNEPITLTYRTPDTIR